MSSFYRNTYLKSEHWQNLRLQKLVESDCLCLRCGKQSQSNDVHHLCYKKLYDVKTVDLVVLCRTCHDFVHEKLDQIKLLDAESPPDKALTVWKLFLETWGPHPNDHIELRRQMVALRKRGKMWNHVEQAKKDKLDNPSKGKQSPPKNPYKCSPKKVFVPLNKEEFDLYDERAKEAGLWLPDWIAIFLRDRIGQIK